VTTNSARDQSDQQARTLLAWRRTALSLVAAGVLVAQLAIDRAGRGPVTVALLALAAVTAFAWLSPLRRPAAAGLCLVVGVVVLGALSLLAVLSGGPLPMAPLVP
jgi:uncharacterized membrane protein YidH (DUF202 family)